jgi:predicted lipid carrier protein YhbT
MTDPALEPPPFLLPAPLAAIGRRLPQLPHSAAAAVVLNILLLPSLERDTLDALRGHVIAFHVSDAGIDCRVRLAGARFLPCLAATHADVAIRACAHDFLLLANRSEDPDTLFFLRRLAIEGDTALGLTVKNALDAVDWTPASFLAAIVRSLAPAGRDRGFPGGVGPVR